MDNTDFEKKLDESLNELLNGLSKAVAKGIKNEIEPETLARFVMHFAFMTNGKLADDYQLALRTAAETLAQSSECVRDLLASEEDEHEEIRIDHSVTEGATLH
jgi:hypothetical protein